METISTHDMEVEDAETNRHLLNADLLSSINPRFLSGSSASAYQTSSHEQSFRRWTFLAPMSSGLTSGCHSNPKLSKGAYGSYLRLLLRTSIRRYVKIVHHLKISPRTNQLFQLRSQPLKHCHSNTCCRKLHSSELYFQSCRLQPHCNFCWTTV
jgi:hypothetical protein